MHCRSVSLRVGQCVGDCEYHNSSGARFLAKSPPSLRASVGSVTHRMCCPCVSKNITTASLQEGYWNYLAGDNGSRVCSHSVVTNPPMLCTYPSCHSQETRVDYTNAAFHFKVWSLDFTPHLEGQGVGYPPSSFGQFFSCKGRLRPAILFCLSNKRTIS